MTGIRNNTEMRKLHEIARDIQQNWPSPYFGAVPYIQAMRQVETLDGYIGMDSGRSVVSYFLANAGTWRGDDARRIKKELNDMLKR